MPYPPFGVTVNCWDVPPLQTWMVGVLPSAPPPASTHLLVSQAGRKVQVPDAPAKTLKYEPLPLADSGHWSTLVPGELLAPAMSKSNGLSRVKSA